MSSKDGQSPETYRLFISISLPEHVKDEIEKAQEELRSAWSRDRVRWTRRVQFHVTLTFLGEVEPRCVDALTNALRLACEGFGVLSLCVGRIGVFPDLRRPRLIWVRVHDAPERLPLLQRAVETAAAGFTSQEPERAFTGHVTLGRCQTIERTLIELRADLAKAMENRQFGAWTADRIDIVRSQLGQVARATPRYPGFRFRAIRFEGRWDSIEPTITLQGPGGHRNEIVYTS